MKHRIFYIGFTSSYTCYLDIPEDEAIRRYKEENGEFYEKHGDSVTVNSFDFDDEFEVYDIN